MLHIASPSSGSELFGFDVNTDISPNAVDLRLKKVFKIESSVFILSETAKCHRFTTEVPLDVDGFWNLWPGSYEIVLGDKIRMAANEAGFVIPRSTLNRNGVFITTGLYDSGYEGTMAACMHVTTDLFKVAPDTRVAQFLLFPAESLKQYDGSYGFKDGAPKPEEAKYHK